MAGMLLQICLAVIISKVSAATDGTSMELAAVSACVLKGGRISFLRDANGQPTVPRCLVQTFCPTKSVEAYGSCVAPAVQGQAMEIAITLHSSCSACIQDQGISIAGKLWLSLVSALQVPLQESKASVLLSGASYTKRYPMKHFTLKRQNEAPLVTATGGSLSSVAADDGQRYDFFMAVRIHTARIAQDDEIFVKILASDPTPLKQVLGSSGVDVDIFEVAPTPTQEVLGVDDLVAAFQLVGYDWNQQPAQSSNPRQPPNQASGAGSASSPSPTTTAQVSGCACQATWIGDGMCDTYCNTKACNWDGGDCSLTSTSTKPPTSTAQSTSAASNSGIKSGCVCDASWLGDGMCDKVCNVADCGFDGGDCSATSAKFTPQRTTAISTSFLPRTTATEGCRCSLSWIGDGTCDGYCNTKACNWDGGDCSETPGSPSTSKTGSAGSATNAELDSLAAADSIQNSPVVSLSIKNGTTSNSWLIQASSNGKVWNVDPSLEEESIAKSFFNPVFFSLVGVCLVCVIPALCLAVRRRFVRLGTSNSRPRVSQSGIPIGKGGKFLEKTPQAWHSSEAEDPAFERTWSSRSTTISGTSEDQGSSQAPSYWEYWTRIPSKEAKVHPEDQVDPEIRDSHGAWRKPGKTNTWTFSSVAEGKTEGPRPSPESWNQPEGPRTPPPMNWYQRQEQERQKKMQDHEELKRQEAKRAKEEQEEWCRQWREKDEAHKNQKKVKESERQRQQKEQQDHQRKQREKQMEQEARRRQEEQQRQEEQARQHQEHQRRQQEERNRQQKEREQQFKEQKAAENQSKSFFSSRFRSRSEPPKQEKASNATETDKGSRWTRFSGSSRSESSAKPQSTAAERKAQVQKEKETKEMEKKANSLLENVIKQIDSTRNESLENRKKIFRELQRQLHPDKNLDCQEAAKLAFQRLMDSRNTYLAS